MAAPPVKPRKLVKDHANEVIQFEEIVEDVGRPPGYGSLLEDKHPWQRDQLKAVKNARETTSTG